MHRLRHRIPVRKRNEHDRVRLLPRHHHLRMILHDMIHHALEVRPRVRVADHVIRSATSAQYVHILYNYEPEREVEVSVPLIDGSRFDAGATQPRSSGQRGGHCRTGPYGQFRISRFALERANAAGGIPTLLLGRAEERILAACMARTCIHCDKADQRGRFQQ